MEKFAHDQLDIYQLSIEFVAIADEVTRQLPGERQSLAAQLQHAATLISLNIAEEAAESSPEEKTIFSQQAKSAVTECACLLDIYQALSLIELPLFLTAREILLRIADEMLHQTAYQS